VGILLKIFGKGSWADFDSWKTRDAQKRKTRTVFERSSYDQGKMEKKGGGGSLPETISGLKNNRGVVMGCQAVVTKAGKQF